jgi:hypothetical protein
MKMAVAPAPCELAVRVVIPSLRALVAKELTQTYSLKQQEIASALGVTQSAVSQYVRSVRGKTLDLDGIVPIDRIVKETAELISKNEASAAYINRQYCQACRLIRESRLLCALHRRFDPDFDIQECTACLPSNITC